MLKSFGTLPTGQLAELVCLRNGPMACEVLTWGATLRSLTVPGKDGPVDVVLGYDTLEEYLTKGGHLGATVGRCANRIARGSFTLEGVPVQLALNKPPHHIHGGIDQFSNRVWTVESLSDSEVTLTLDSPDGDQGYPGHMAVSVTYRLTENALELRYRAVTDKVTLCNLTNHSYFNLAGLGGGEVLDQELRLFCSAYTPGDKDGMPTGEILPVAGTPMDFLTLRPMGERIMEDYAPLRLYGGYDHNYVVDGALAPDGTLAPAVLRPVALARSARTGVVMETFTTLPGVQFFTANTLKTTGKGGAVYGPFHGFCLETQFFPDAVHHSNFPVPVLRPGEVWDHVTRYAFSRY